jgi:hypothetical protein
MRNAGEQDGDLDAAQRMAALRYFHAQQQQQQQQPPQPQQLLQHMQVQYCHGRSNSRKPRSVPCMRLLDQTVLGCCALV